MWKEEKKEKEKSEKQEKKERDFLREQDAKGWGEEKGGDKRSCGDNLIQ